MIYTQGPWFVDEQGRTLMLRGVNVAGSSKVPIGFPTHRREGFFDQRPVSFLGGPFSLAGGGEHFSRLPGWGPTPVRLGGAWGGIEEARPGASGQADHR